MWSFGTTMTMANEEARPAETPQPPQAPGPSQPPQAPESLLTQTPQVAPRTPILSQRSLQQLGLFFAGAGFLALSTLITRRSVARKIAATVPKFYHQSNRPVTKMDGDSSLIALEALNLATLNVMGFGIMATGGLAWAFDVSGLEDLRNLARRHIGPPGGRTDEEAEREVEEWVAKVLLRREEIERESDGQGKRDA
jgi:hypothetical protein